MAIDDNKNYTLTGAQVKDLPSKINAAKGAPRELSAEDYNWPTQTPTGVALWKMPAGMYFAPDGVKVYSSQQKATTAGAEGVFFINMICGGVKTISITADWVTERSSTRGPYIEYLTSGTATYSGYLLGTGGLATTLSKNVGGAYIGYSDQAASTSLVADIFNLGHNGQSHAPTSTDSARQGAIWTCYDPNDPTVGHIYMCTDSDYVHNNWTWIQLI